MILNVAINNLGGGGGGNLPPVANFTFTTSGLTANFTDTSTDSDGTIASRSWTFGDGGTSTATNPSHTYAANGTYTVTLTVTDNGGAQNTKSTPVTVSVAVAVRRSCSAIRASRTARATAPWTLSSGVINNSTSEPPHAGSWDAWMDGYGRSHTDTSSQTVTIPAGKTSATLQYYLHIDTAETTGSTAYDTLKVQVTNTSGTVLSTLATWSNLNHANGYVVHSSSLNSFIGQTVVIKFLGVEDVSLQTSFVLDDVTLTVQ